MEQQKHSETEYPYLFSVVMAVYNVEPFLEEAVQSLIDQDIGFEQIQLILVDDGSKDGSPAICDHYAARYPENIVVIHKPNGGVSSARNAGLPLVRGRFVNFMDSDDKFSPNTFSAVYDFFVKNEELVDLVTVPLEFFDQQTGPHWQNYKFNKGTRILDLFYDYQAALMFVNASFFARRVLDQITFDPHLVCGEDIKVILTILAGKMKYGVVREGTYEYRRRSVGEASLVQAAKKKYGWYFDYFTYLVDWITALYQERFGYLPAFVQYELLGDIQWRYGQLYDMSEVLTPEEIAAYKSRMAETLRRFDDKYIMEQRMIWDENKCYMLSQKYGCPPELVLRDTNVIVHFGNTVLKSFADQYSRIDFIRLNRECIEIEGFTKLFGVGLEEPVTVLIKIVKNGEEETAEFVEAEPVLREEINEYRFDDLIFRGIGFRCKVPLSGEAENYTLRIAVQYRGTVVVKRTLRFGNFSPVGNEYQNGYYHRDGWLLQASGRALTIRKCGRRGHLKQELAFLKELWRKKTNSNKKAVLGRLCYHLIRPFRRKRIWLLSDRPTAAGDNGEALFKFLVKNKKKESFRPVFVLEKQSKDYRRVGQYGTVVPHLSWRQKMIFLLSDVVASSHADTHVYNPFFEYYPPYRDLMQKKIVFLQHGITKDDISRWYNRYKAGISGFVTAARPEYESILGEQYHYTPAQVWLTGFPRFDLLEHDEKKIVSIMPSWRAYLVQADQSNGARHLLSGFENSAYFQMYSGLLQNERLLAAARQYGYRLRYVSHPNMRGDTEHFSFGKEIELTSPDEPYAKIFAESDLLLTDYSSVAFDFSYLRKPVLYYQSDREEFFSGKHTLDRGYFDYERDGFGEVEYDLEGTVDRLIEYMESGCQLKDKYRERIDSFFAFNDQNNCQRVYEKIMELEKETSI